MGISETEFQALKARVENGQRGPKGKPRPLERKLHEEIIEFCNNQWPRWKFIHSRMDQPTCNEKGVPDFVILLPKNRVALIEAKRIGEKVSPAQRDWHAEALRLGHTVFVVHTMEEFLQVVTNHK